MEISDFKKTPNTFPDKGLYDLGLPPLDDGRLQLLRNQSDIRLTWKSWYKTLSNKRFLQIIFQLDNNKEWIYFISKTSICKIKNKENINFFFELSRFNVKTGKSDD